MLELKIIIDRCHIFRNGEDFDVVVKLDYTSGEIIGESGISYDCNCLEVGKAVL